MVSPQGIIKLNLEIFKTIIATTVRYANARIPDEEWAEVYGLLYGYNDGKNVMITEAINALGKVFLGNYFEFMLEAFLHFVQFVLGSTFVFYLDTIFTDLSEKL